jgi:hypothetical protein
MKKRDRDKIFWDVVLMGLFISVLLLCGVMVMQEICHIWQPDPIMTTQEYSTQVLEELSRRGF